jgi:RNA polymerase sigma-70 factor (ECF subfamily)
MLGVFEGMGLAAACDGPMHPPRSDAELVDAARRGDRDAFGELVVRHQERVYNLSLRFLGNPTAAEDLAQRVFISAFTQLKHFKGEAAFTTWIYRITFNESVTVRRTEGRRRAVSIHGADEGLIAEPAETDDPAEALTQQEERGALHRALQEIGAEDRKILLMREMEEMPYEQIAAVLQIPVGTVRSRLHRAREALRAALGEGVRRT